MATSTDKAKIKERETITRAFFEKVFSMYPNGVELWGIKDVLSADHKAFAIGKVYSVDEAMHLLKQENAWWKNDRYSYDFYYKPADIKKFSYLFFDFDFTPERELLKSAFVIVNTSAGKYHLYFEVEVPISANEYKSIMKALIKHVESVNTADPACVDPYHLRRLAGFLNNKHKEHLISFTKGENVIIPKSVISKAREYAIAEEYAEKGVATQKQKEMQSSINGDAAVWIEKHQNDRLISYRDPNVMSREKFKDYIHTDDQSVIDYAYTCYLMSKGWSVKEIFEAIRDQREDLVKKHPMWIDYLKRTIEKAGVKMYAEMQKKVNTRR